MERSGFAAVCKRFYRPLSRAYAVRHAIFRDRSDDLGQTLREVQPRWRTRGRRLTRLLGGPGILHRDVLAEHPRSHPFS